MEVGHYLQFTLEGQSYALRLSAVIRVIAAVMVSPLPHAPEIVLGVFNLSGRILPVVNVRRRFRLPDREQMPSDKFIIARAQRQGGADRLLALCVDDVVGVCELPDKDVIASSAVLPGLGFLEGIARTEAGVLLIHDLRTFLALEEAQVLDASLAEQEG